VSEDRACPTAPGANVGRRRRTGAQKPQERLGLAIEAFNASREARMVAGLIRTLGQPQVSVGAAAGSQAEVRITVAWELSWYQWAVDVSGPRATVARIGSGREVSELDVSARVWNGGVAKDGELHLGRPRRDTPRRRRLRSLRLR
jgi:hypothetical protein